MLYLLRRNVVRILLYIFALDVDWLSLIIFIILVPWNKIKRWNDLIDYSFVIDNKNDNGFNFVNLLFFYYDYSYDRAPIIIIIPVKGFSGSIISCLSRNEKNIYSHFFMGYRNSNEIAEWFICECLHQISRRKLHILTRQYKYWRRWSVYRDQILTMHTDLLTLCD